MLTRQMDTQTARGDHLQLLGGLSSITTLTSALYSNEKQSSVTYSSFYSNSQVAVLQQVNGLRQSQFE